MVLPALSAHLPVAGDFVLFNRSWYNRAGAGRVMGFCTKAEFEEFMETVLGFSMRSVLRRGLSPRLMDGSVEDRASNRE